jgi:glycosyltransferase involved in cell wall biosynthesis
LVAGLAAVGYGLSPVQPHAAVSRSPRPAPPARMRVLHIVSHSHRRGSELAALELAGELERLGHWNRVVAMGPALGGGRDADLAPLGRSWGEGPPELVSLVWRLRRLLVDEPVDVVVAHGGWPAQVAAWAVPRGGPFLVWQRILGLPAKVWDPVRRRWWRIVARRFHAAVALTDDQVVELRRLGFGGPVWVIPNFRRPDRFRGLDRAAAGARLRSEVGVPDGVPLIGFVGHLVGQKRLDRALKVLALLPAEGCRAHLVVAGTGPLRAELEAHAARLGVAADVTFLGHRDDVEWVFGGVDLALLTSDSEGIPGVAIEALMAGCPMVTVAVGGVTEVVEHGVTGLVLEADPPASMAGAVARLLADGETRAAMSRASLSRTDQFTAAAAAAVYTKRLTDALAER